jgi:hypothetical protein
MSGNSKRPVYTCIKTSIENRKMIATLLSKKNLLILEFTISLMDALALVYINVISLQTLVE